MQRSVGLALAATAVTVAAGLAFWFGRGHAATREPDPGQCRLERGAVYAFVGLGPDFRTAVIDVAHPDIPCVDGHLPRDARSVGVRGSDGALLYLREGKVLQAAGETRTWSEMRKTWTYAREPKPDVEIASARCGRGVEGFLTAPDSDRLVYWCVGEHAFHDTHGRDLALNPSLDERPVVLGNAGTTLARSGQGKPALWLVGPGDKRVEVSGLEPRFTRAYLPSRAAGDGFLVLLPKGLTSAHDLYRIDKSGRATVDQRYEDVPEAQIGTLDPVVDDDGGLHMETRLGSEGAEAVVRFPPNGGPFEIVYRPKGDARLASPSLFSAP